MTTRKPIRTPDGHPVNPYMYPLDKIFGFRREFSMADMRHTPPHILEAQAADAEEHFRRFVFNELDRLHYTTTSLTGWSMHAVHHVADNEHTMGRVHSWSFPNRPERGDRVLMIGGDWTYYDTRLGHNDIEDIVADEWNEPRTTRTPRRFPPLWLDLYTGQWCTFTDHHTTTYAPPYMSPATHFPHPTQEKP